MPSDDPASDGARVRRIATVRGRVQGVGFRWSTAGEAQRRGLDGWVRNRPDGGVEVAMEGPPDIVDGMLAWLRVGPPGAAVTSVESTAQEPDATGAGGTGFSIR